MDETKRNLLMILGAVVGLTAVDVAADLHFGSSLRHILVEIGIIVVAALGIMLLSLRTVETYHNRLAQYSEDTRHWKAEAERWRAASAAHLKGLSNAIDQQFEEWGLTGSEKEVAFLLLKGLSLKESAEVRGVAEKTIRKQTLGIYRKGQLSGRADLAAFFLEDLLVPPKPLSNGKP